MKLNLGAIEKLITSLLGKILIFIDKGIVSSIYIH